jgi:predicted PurR-regulated permease PerM
LVVVYLIIRPFLTPLILAAVFAFIFHPLYRRVLNIFKGRKSLAAFFVTVISAILIIAPLTLLGNQIFKETSQMYQAIVGDGKGVSSKSIEYVISQIQSVLPIPKGYDINLSEYVMQGLSFLIQNFVVIFSSFAKIMFDALVFVIAFYFFIKDGGKMKDYFINLSPLADKDDEFVLSKLKTSVSSVVKGNLAIGVIQGLLTGIGFAIFGVSNAALWGVVAAVAALVPGLGTAIVVVPAVIYLYLSGNTFGWVGLSIWGATAVGLIDNLLGPKLIGRGMGIHPLAVFVSVLGGLAFFGPLGFLLGPLTMSICLALIDIYFSLKTQAAK